MTCSLRSLVLSIATLTGLAVPAWSQDRLAPITYNNPGLVVDLGVGLWAWPLPMDYDGDGDMDLVVSCPDKPFNGVYFFENPGTAKSPKELPVFKPPVRLGPSVQNIQISHTDGKERLLAPGVEYLNFREKVWGEQAKLGLPAKIDPEWKRYRANQWKAVDWDGDGAQDLLIGIEVWDDYGWDDAWDKEGNWKNGPLHGFVFFVRNEGTDAKPKYAAPVKLESNGKPIDVFGMPGPSAADFDGDGDVDLICGEFLDGFTYFENVGSRKKPKLAEGRRLAQLTLVTFGAGTNQANETIARSHEIRMDLQMITPTAIDWDGDGDIDLICGDEDGRVALIENTGKVSAGMPQFQQPQYFQQEAADVKFGALAAPFGVDWDGDGDDDILCGNTAGYIAFIENLGGGGNPAWAAPRLLNQFGRQGSDIGSTHLSNVLALPGVPLRVVREQAGPKGSIQGPCEARWGYSTLSVADWNHDGIKDVVANGIWGKVHWHAGFDKQPSFDRDNVVTASQPVQVRWDGTPQKTDWSWWTPDPNTLATQWRTTPCAVDWNGDGLTDLVMLDHEGYLVFFERAKPAAGATQTPPPLLPPKRLFKMEGPCEFDSRHKTVGEKKDDLLRLNANRIGASGRRKLHVVDWDGDGRLDLLVNSINANWLRNDRTDDDGFVWFQDMGPLDDVILTGHDTAPATVDWDKNGIPDLLVGAEDGRLYYKRNPRAIAQNTTESDASADGAILVSEFLYETAPFPSCHASTIVETPSGLVAAWFGGTREKDKDVGIWVSRHVGGRWTPVVEVANGVQHSTLRHPCWNPVLYTEPGIGNDGKSTALHLFYKCGPDPKTWWGMHTVSLDDGATWSTPVRLPEGIDGPVKNKPVTLSTGELLSGSSTEYDGWRLHFEIAADWGRPRHNGTQLLTNWQRIGPINDGKEFNAIQPSILLHGGSKLQILCRSREGSILTSWSEDNGRSWSPVERTSLPNNNSGTDAVTLADGRHVLIYNHTQKGRSPLNVAVSEDGKNWQAALVLESEPGEYSYPAVIQTKDGLLHFTYTWKRQKIRHVAVNPKKLALQPIVDGNWPQ